VPHAFDSLSSDALGPAESLKLLEKVAGELE
jgi:hypothetical protein